VVRTQRVAKRHDLMTDPDSQADSSDEQGNSQFPHRYLPEEVAGVILVAPHSVSKFTLLVLGL